jgi:hypothetical protein
MDLEKPYEPPGFVRVSPFDSVGRRALWLKFDRETLTLEIRAGREGDDVHVSFRPGQVLDGKTVFELLDALERARSDCGGDDREMPWGEVPAEQDEKTVYKLLDTKGRDAGH